MIAQITPYYTRRQSLIYRSAYVLQSHFSLVLVLSIASILSYPIGKYSYFRYQQHQKQAEIVHLSENIAQQQSRLLKLSPATTPISQEENLTDLNQQIQRIFNQHQIPIESLQWQFDGSKTLRLTANSTTSKILVVIEALNAIPALRFNEIRLIKLNYEQKIQLQATLTPVSPIPHPLNEEAQ